MRHGACRARAAARFARLPRLPRFSHYAIIIYAAIFAMIFADDDL
jgi:hypothetical protein